MTNVKEGKTKKSPFTIHEKEIIVNRDKLKTILKSKNVEGSDKGMSYLDLHEKISTKYGLDITYKGLVSLLNNRSTWKLLYAYAIIDVLSIGIDDIFEVIEIDVDKKVIEKEIWKEKYQH